MSGFQRGFEDLFNFCSRFPADLIKPSPDSGSWGSFSRLSLVKFNETDRFLFSILRCSLGETMSDEYPKTYKGPYFSLVVPDKESEPTPEQLADFLDEENQRKQLEKATEKTIQEINDGLEDLLNELP